MIVRRCHQRGGWKDTRVETEKDNIKKTAAFAVVEGSATSTTTAAAVSSSVGPLDQMAGPGKAIQVGGDLCEAGHHRYEYESFPPYPERRVCCVCDASP